MNRRVPIPLPSLHRLHELFELDSTAGTLIAKTDRPKCPAGTVIGTSNSNGRLICRVDYEIYYVHRIIWKMHHGLDPPQKVDHRSRNKQENGTNNLRGASDCQNMWNIDVKKKTKSGLKGAHWSSSEKKWRSSIRAAGKPIHLGWFKTKEEAHAVYVAASLHMHGEFSVFHEGNK